MSDRSEYLGSADLDAILAALDMPPEGLRRWFDDLRGFCDEHGGDRYYGDLMALIEACRQRLRGAG